MQVRAFLLSLVAALAIRVCAVPIVVDDDSVQVYYARNLPAHLQTLNMANVHPIHHDGHGNVHPNTHPHVTFAGTVPAHQTGRMTPEQLNSYAQHVHTQLRQQNPNMPHIVVAASHKEGQGVVRIHTAPRGSSYQEHQHGNLAVPTAAMRASGLADRTYVEHNGVHFPVHTYHHHAESAVLRASLHAVGAHDNNIAGRMAGHTIGVAGSWHNPETNAPEAITRPCQRCRGYLDSMSVWHRPGTQAPAPPSGPGARR